MISIDSSKKSGRSGGDNPGGDDPEALWDHVTRDVKPLSSRKSERSAPVAPSPPLKTRMVKKSVPENSPPVVKKPVRTPGDQEVDRRTDQKLKRGQYPVDATLDLHGLTQAAAHGKLLQVLRSGYARGYRCVLVITGKGRGEGQGVLRRKVPEWLAEENLRSMVLRFHKAQPEHGGDGALYVLLRRKRTD